jgi:hypothetical protein
VRRLIECKEIKLHRARQILVELRGHNNPDT